MKKILQGYVCCIYFLLYLPILVVVAFSFNNSKYTISWKGFTLQWYESLINNPSIIESTLHSLLLACLSATAATVLGTIIALTLKRYSFRGHAILLSSIYTLTILPDIVMGIAFLICFITLRIDLGFIPLFIAHTTLGIPFIVLTLLTRFASLSDNLVEAAQDLGATDWQAFRLILLPLLFPALVAGWILSFTLSIDDVLISFFLTTPEYNLLSLQIYSMVRLGIKPDINALSSIMFLITIVFISVAYWITEKKR